MVQMKMFRNFELRMIRKLIIRSELVENQLKKQNMWLFKMVEMINELWTSCESRVLWIKPDFKTVNIYYFHIFKEKEVCIVLQFVKFITGNGFFDSWRKDYKYPS